MKTVDGGPVLRRADWGEVKVPEGQAVNTDQMLRLAEVPWYDTESVERSKDAILAEIRQTVNGQQRFFNVVAWMATIAMVACLAVLTMVDQSSDLAVVLVMSLAWLLVPATGISWAIRDKLTYRWIRTRVNRHSYGLPDEASALMDKIRTVRKDAIIYHDRVGSDPFLAVRHPDDKTIRYFCTYGEKGFFAPTCS